MMKSSGQVKTYSHSLQHWEQKLNMMREMSYHIPNHPDAALYESVSLHCYLADRRTTNGDCLNALVKQYNEEAKYLELRLAGKAF